MRVFVICSLIIVGMNTSLIAQGQKVNLDSYGLMASLDLPKGSAASIDTTLHTGFTVFRIKSADGINIAITERKAKFGNNASKMIETLKDRLSKSKIAKVGEVVVDEPQAYLYQTIDDKLVSSYSFYYFVDYKDKQYECRPLVKNVTKEECLKMLKVAKTLKFK